jgi:hypothetical protein
VTLETTAAASTRLLLLLLLVAACAAGRLELVAPPFSPKGGDKVDTRVALVLDDALREAIWKGPQFQIPLGDTLVSYSEALARSIFANVSVASVQAEADGIAGSAIGLTPRLVSFTRSAALWAHEDQTCVAILEWTLRDARGEILWIGTFTGEATEKVGSAFSVNKNTRKTVVKALWAAYTASLEGVWKAGRSLELAAEGH